MTGTIVVLFNPTEDEVLNVSSYYNMVDFSVVIDNSDADNDVWVKNLLPDSGKIIYYSEHKNLGLCKALNIGVDILSKKGCDKSVVFDADSKPANNIFEIYSHAAEKYKNEKVAVFSPVHIFDRSSNQPYDGYKEVPWSMTSGWMIDNRIFRELGGFFEPLFVDGLDMDYCYRATENGYKIIECGKAVLNHNPAETKSFLGFRYGIASPFRYFMQARQLLWCALRFRKFYPVFVYCYKWFKVIFLFPDKKEYFSSMIKGSKEGINLYKNHKTGC